jgi:hypothetical protein
LGSQFEFAPNIAHHLVKKKCPRQFNIAMHLMISDNTWDYLAGESLQTADEVNKNVQDVSALPRTVPQSQLLLLPV